MSDPFWFKKPEILLSKRNCLKLDPASIIDLFKPVSVGTRKEHLTPYFLNIWMVEEILVSDLESTFIKS